jgi:hypothetical protein
LHPSPFSTEEVVLKMSNFESGFPGQLLFWM